MEKDIQIIEYKEVDLSNSILIEAFPTVGLVSSIAGHFIIDQLKLEEIGTISPDISCLQQSSITVSHLHR